MPFQILTEFPPHTANNSCCACRCDRRPTDRLFDLGFSLDLLVDNDGLFTNQEGYAILCETCLRELANMAGYGTEDTSRELASLRGEVATLREDKVRLELIIDSVNAAVG